MIDAAVTAWAVTLAALLIVREEKPLVDPAFDENVKLPVPSVRSRDPGPLTVFKNWMLVLLEEELIVAVPKLGTVTGPLKEMAPPAASDPFKETAPDVFWLNAPAMLRFALEPRVSVPVCVTVIAAPLLPVVVVTELLMVNPLPIKLTPATPFVLTAPLNVVVPVPASCEMAEAVIAPAVTLAAVLIVSVPMRVDPPIALLRVIDPAPEFRLRFCAPFTVFERMMSPVPPPPVLKETGPAKVMAPAKEMFWFAARIDPFKETAPPPL